MLTRGTHPLRLRIFNKAVPRAIMRKRRQKVDRLVHAIGALDHPLEQFISLLVNSVEVAIRWVQMRISDNCASRCEELFQDVRGVGREWLKLGTESGGEGEKRGVGVCREGIRSDGGRGGEGGHEPTAMSTCRRM